MGFPLRAYRGRRFCPAAPILPYAGFFGLAAGCLGLGTAEPPALHDSGEVLQILSRVPLGVGEGVIDGLPVGSGRRVLAEFMATSMRVRPGATSSKRSSPLVEMLPPIVFQPMPRPWPTSVVHGLEPGALAERSFHLPMARVLPRHPNPFDVGHRIGIVLEIPPVAARALYRRLRLDALPDLLRHALPLSIVGLSRQGASRTGARL